MRRAAQILAQLEAARFVAPDELIRLLNVSRRTLGSDIAALNDILGSAASIATIDSRLRLMVADPDRYAQVKMTLKQQRPSFNDPNVRMSYLVSRLFRAFVPVRIEELASAMSVGRTTVVNDLTRLRETLAESGLLIEGRQNVGIELVGPELVKRLLVLRHHWDLTYPNDAPVIDEVCAAVVEDIGLHAGIAPELVRWARITLDRVSSGWPLDGLPDHYKGLAETPAFGFANALAAALSEKTGIAIAGDEVTFLALPVIGMRAHTSEHLSSVDAQDLAGKVLQAINEQTDIDLDGSAMLPEFAQHLAFMINRMRYQIWLDDAGMGDIGNQYPLAYEMAVVAARFIEQVVGFPVDKAEMCFLAVYFQVFLEKRASERTSALNVVVLGTKGRVETELLRLQLGKIWPESAVLSVVVADYIDHDRIAQADLVIVDGDVPVETSSPVIRLSTALDGIQFARQIERLQLHLPMRPNLSTQTSVLAGALDEDHFFALPAGTDYLEALEYMTRQLNAKGLIEDGFGERVLERERSTTMRFGTWVAFPHTTLMHESNVVLSIGVVPREPDEDGPRIIVMLGVPSDKGRSEEILISLYDEVLRLGARRDLVEGISHQTSYQDFFYFMDQHPLVEREH